MAAIKHLLNLSVAWHCRKEWWCCCQIIDYIWELNLTVEITWNIKIMHGKVSWKLSKKPFRNTCKASVCFFSEVSASSSSFAKTLQLETSISRGFYEILSNFLSKCLFLEGGRRGKLIFGRFTTFTHGIRTPFTCAISAFFSPLLTHLIGNISVYCLLIEHIKHVQTCWEKWNAI